MIIPFFFTFIDTKILILGGLNEKGLINSEVEVLELGKNKKNFKYLKLIFYHHYNFIINN